MSEKLVFVAESQTFQTPSKNVGLLNGLAELPPTRALFVQCAAELKKRLV